MIAKIGKSVSAAPASYVAIAAISATPIVQGLLTTTLDGGLTLGQAIVRIFSVITILTDIFVLNLAIKSNFSIAGELDRLGNRSKILVALLVLIAFASIFANEGSPTQSLFITIRYVCQVVTLFALIFLIAREQRFEPERYLTIMTIFAAAYVAYIAFVALLVRNPSTFVWTSGLPSATSIRHIGNYVALFSIAAIAVFLFADRRHRWLSLLSVFFLTTFLGWTGSRAAIVGVGVALVVALFALRRDVSVRHVAMLAVTMGLALAATLALPTPDREFGLVRMIKATDARQSNDISSDRFSMWQNTAHEIAAAPVLGHGSGRFAGNMYDKYKYDYDNPHNFVLQFAYDWGLGGLVIAVTLLAMIGFAVFWLPVISPMASFAALSGYTLLVVIGMLEGMLYHPLKMLLASALIAPAWGLARRESTAAPTWQPTRTGTRPVVFREQSFPGS